MFQYEDDANAVIRVLPKRLGKFSLEVAPENEDTSVWKIQGNKGRL
jgi:hypothetical protein